MLGRILLDNDYYLVTAGFLGAIKVTLKSRGLTLKATRKERAKLLDVLNELKRRGYSVEPDSKEFEKVLSDFSKALSGVGDARWKAYFLVMTSEDIVSDVIGEAEDTKNSDNLEHKDSDLNLKVDDYKMAYIAYDNWKEKARVRVKYIEKFVVNGQIKFENVEEVYYEIDGFLNYSREWEFEGDERLYDFSKEARQLLNNLNFSSIE
jgi:hypothetical protein